MSQSAMELQTASIEVGHLLGRLGTLAIECGALRHDVAELLQATHDACSVLAGRAVEYGRQEAVGRALEEARN